MTLVLLLVYCNYFNVLCGVSAERFCKVTDIVSFPQIFQELFFRSRAALPLQRGCFPKASAKVVAFSEPTKYFNIFLSQNFHMKSQPAVSAAVMAQSFFSKHLSNSHEIHGNQIQQNVVREKANGYICGNTIIYTSKYPWQRITN